MASLYPLVNFRFSVSIDDTVDAAFSEISGLDTEMATETIEEGGENRFSYTLPTRGTHGNLVLKRGILDGSTGLFRWCRDAMEQGLAKTLTLKTINVSLLDMANQPVLSWKVLDCWPVKMNVSPLDAKNGDVVVETLEFAFTSLTRRYG